MRRWCLSNNPKNLREQTGLVQVLWVCLVLEGRRGPFGWCRRSPEREAGDWVRGGNQEKPNKALKTLPGTLAFTLSEGVKPLGGSGQRSSKILDFSGYWAEFEGEQALKEGDHLGGYCKNPGRVQRAASNKVVAIYANRNDPAERAGMMMQKREDCWFTVFEKEGRDRI